MLRLFLPGGWSTCSPALASSSASGRIFSYVLDAGELVGDMVTKGSGDECLDLRGIQFPSEPVQSLDGLGKTDENGDRI